MSDIPIQVNAVEIHRRNAPMAARVIYPMTSKQMAITITVMVVEVVALNYGAEDFWRNSVYSPTRISKSHYSGSGGCR